MLNHHIQLLIHLQFSGIAILWISYFGAISEQLLQTLNKIDLDLIAVAVLLALDAPSKLSEPGL